jgi:hypothetical protein
VPTPTAKLQYSALKQRLGAALNGAPNQQTTADISGQLAGAQVALNDAKERHDQTNTTLQNLLQSLGRADRAGRGADIVAADKPQATLQTTAMLLKTSILQYI